jgi:phospholipid/cholesterol/gamma-HCH transport system substrate-binding protein
MKIKFNKFERVAGLFVGVALIGSMAISGGVAVKKGWFASKTDYFTYMESAEGIHPGTPVQIQGLRAGSVRDIELEGANRVKVNFTVLSKFKNKIRIDSQVQVVRPFIIGEKVLDVTVGSEQAAVLSPKMALEIRPSFDIMELMSGKKMGPFLGTIEQLAVNLKILAEAFADMDRTKALVKAFDRVEPLLQNLNQMSQEVVKVTKIVTKKERLETIVTHVASLTKELDQVVPALNQEAPDLGKQMAQVVKNLNILTVEFQKLTPAITAIAPELPKTSIRAVEALNETVVLLKAMQKSFFLKGKVEEVLEEEKSRTPASQ